jgi:dimethyladenosine transferase
MALTDISIIKDVLSRNGFRFSKSMGQNFLTASWVPEEIAENAMIDDKTCVLEIGPGIGCLTEQLAPLAKKVVCIELDKALAPVLEETVGHLENVEIIFGDVLKQNLAELVENHFDGLRPVVCANLPYNITTPVLSALFESGIFEYITVMIQREVARRLCAAPGTSDYGAFTLHTNWYTEPEILFDVSPGCFMPQPKVTSSVIRLKGREKPPVDVVSGEKMFKIIRASFNQRRKTLPNALSGMAGFTKTDVEEALTGMGIDVRIRGEALGLSEFASLTNLLYKND